MTQTKKVENFEKVRKYVRTMDNNSLTNYDIQQKIGLNYSQSDKFLSGLVELGELKYLPSLKIYVREYK